MARAFNILPLKTPVDTNGVSMNREWYPWFQNASNAVNSLYQSGTTAERPTTNVYLGQLYFDTTLGTLVMITNLDPLTWVPFVTNGTFTPDAFLFTNAFGDITASGAGTNGQILIGSTGSNPTPGTLTASSGIAVTNGPGSITLSNTGVLSITGTTNEVIASASTGNVTLSLPQPIALTSTPTFGGLTLSDLTQNGFLTIGASGLLGSTAAATDGQLLIGSSSGAPTAANITAGSGISVTNGHNSITISANGSGVVTSITGTANEIITSSSTGNVTLSTPQPIATTSTPTFGGLTLTPLTGYLYGNGASPVTASTTIPNTSITGLGTMSTQNANAVAITGGTINGTSIGATTTSTGAFTTLNASGTITGTASTTALVLGSIPTVYSGNTAMIGQQANSNSALILQRFTNTSPSGYLINGINANNTAQLFSVDVSGNLITAGTLQATGGINSTSIGATTASTGAFTTLSASTSITDSSLTSGSLLFAGTGGILSQNNAQLFWDNTNLRIGLGTNAPSGTMDIATSSSTSWMRFFLNNGGTTPPWTGTNAKGLMISRNYSNGGGEINLVMGTASGPSAPDLHFDTWDGTTYTNRAILTRTGNFSATGGIDTTVIGANTPEAGTFTQLVNTQNVATQGINYQTPSTGFSITLNNTDAVLILDPSGTLATGTITMPASPINGQNVSISSSQTITSLTVSANAGQSIKNAPTTLTVSLTGDQGYKFIYRSANTTWYRLQ